MKKIFSLLLALMLVNVFSVSGDDDHGNVDYKKGSAIMSGDGDHGNVDHGSGIMSGDGDHGNVDYMKGSAIMSGDGDHGNVDHGSAIMSGDGDHGNVDYMKGSAIMSGDGDHGIMSWDGDHGIGAHGSEIMSGVRDLVRGMPGYGDINGKIGDALSGLSGGFDDNDKDDYSFGFMPQLFKPRRRKTKKSKRQAKRKSKKAKRKLMRMQRFCKVKNCIACGLFGCTRCKAGYTLAKTSFFNKRCLSKCPKGQKRIKGKCSKPKKQVCRGIPHCVKCRNAFIPWLRACDKCQNGWFRFKPRFSIRARCIKRCPANYKGINTARGSFCKKIERKCRLLPGCEKCSTPYTCLKCNKKLSLHHGRGIKTQCIRKCPRGHDSVIKNGTKVCELEEGCADQYCAMCKTGWFKIHFRGRKCHKECPSGYYSIGNVCYRCRRGCRKCSSMFSCQSCSKGFAKFERTITGSVVWTQCVSRCPKGYKKEYAKEHVCRQIWRVANCQTTKQSVQTTERPTKTTRQPIETTERFQMTSKSPENITGKLQPRTEEPKPSSANFTLTEPSPKTVPESVMGDSPYSDDP